MTLAEANAFVSRHHRHHGPVVGHLFSVGLAVGGEVVGVAIVGRPVARVRQDGYTAEVTRLCVLPGHSNACSKLYASCWRAARALGYRRLGTYILDDESGASIRAAGWRVVHSVRGRSWSCPSRPRVDLHPLQGKILFEVSL